MMARVKGHWQGGVLGIARSPGFEVNDVGYQRSTNWFLQGGWIGYNHFEPAGSFRSWEANFNAWNGMNFAGEHLSTGINVNGSWNLKNNWGGWWGSDTEFPALRADVLRGGPAFTGPTYTTYNAGVFSDSRKRVYGELYFDGYNELSTVGKSWSVGSTVNLRAGARMRLALGPNVSWGRDPWIFVASPESDDGQAHYVFADIRQRTVSLTTRMTYAFTPRLTLDFYAQPFVAAGEYGGLKEVTDPRAGAFDDRFSRFGTALSLDGGVYSVDRDGATGAAESSLRPARLQLQGAAQDPAPRWSTARGARCSGEEPGPRELGDRRPLPPEPRLPRRSVDGGHRPHQRAAGEVELPLNSAPREGDGDDGSPAARPGLPCGHGSAFHQTIRAQRGSPRFSLARFARLPVVVAAASAARGEACRGRESNDDRVDDQS